MKIKKLIIIIITVSLIFAGCAPKAVPVSGTAEEMKARFEAMFEDYEPADGTIIFEELPPVTTELMTEEMTDPTEVITEETEDMPEEVTELSEDEDEEKFVVTPSGRRYHVQGCRHAGNIHAYLTREEAESRGYDPCRTCNP